MTSYRSAFTRRAFASSIGGAAFALQAPRPRPNILWLVTEDIGPHLGAYGDKYAYTPNLDKFAGTALRYDYCWSNAPVCAPARTSIISGMYPPSLGAEHMRSLLPMAPGMKMFPQYLREAGYYCSNNCKEDYNLEKPGDVWDDSSFAGHWRDRHAGQPFFAVFNFGITHESQVIARRPTVSHDPAEARLPAYYPDSVEVRRDVAQYYDNITIMDRQLAVMLEQLHADGLADDTIVFFYGDNGMCLPRGKRMPYDSGLHVPLIVHVPPKYRDLAPGYKVGGSSSRLVSFVDLAPAVLSLAGVHPPAHMQGRAFLGEHAAAAPQFIFGFRGRMDERYDLMRATRDQRYLYIRNYMPHRIYGEHVAYQWQERSMQEWDRLHREGKLKPPQTLFWETKPYEELYDTTVDADEVKNLARSKAHQTILERMRRAQDGWMREIRDVGLLTEAEMQSRSAGSPPYVLGHDPKRYTYENVKAAADMAASGRDADAPQLVKYLSDGDSAVRYWAATGLLIGKSPAVTAGAEALRRALDDPSPSVRVAAAEALGRYGAQEDQTRSLRILLELASAPRNGIYVSLLAWNSIDQLPVELLRSARAEIEAADVNVGALPGLPGRGGQAGRAAAPGRGDPGRAAPQRAADSIEWTGTYDLFGHGNETAASRAGAGLGNIKATVLDKLSRPR